MPLCNLCLSCESSESSVSSVLRWKQCKQRSSLRSRVTRNYSQYVNKTKMRNTAFYYSPKGTIKITVEILKLNWCQYFESESRLTFWSWSLCDEDLLQLGVKVGGRECVLSPTSYQTIIDKLEERDSQSRAAQELHNHVNVPYLFLQVVDIYT